MSGNATCTAIKVSFLSPYVKKLKPHGRVGVLICLLEREAVRWFSDCVRGSVGLLPDVLVKINITWNWKSMELDFNHHDDITQHLKY